MIKFKEYNKINESNSNFKIGDKVIYNGKYYLERGLYHPSVGDLIGKIGTITDIAPGYTSNYDTIHQSVVVDIPYRETFKRWHCAPYELKIVDDIPEEQDYEEWVEEGKDNHKFKVGDPLICVDSGVNQDLTYGKVYTCLSCSVWEKENFVKVINDNGDDMDFFTWRFKKYDIPEEQDYEEWVEESSSYVDLGFKKGDSLICIYNKSYERELTLGKIYICLSYFQDNGEYFVSIIDDIGKETECYASRFKNDDTPEEQDYEEWIQESNENKFKVGDRILYDSNDDRFLGTSRIATIIGLSGSKVVLNFDDFINYTSVYNDEFNGKEGHTMYFSINDNDLKPYDDIEEQDYEEWVQ